MQVFGAADTFQCVGFGLVVAFSRPLSMAFGQPVGSLSENLIQEMRSLADIDGYQILFSYWTECFCHVPTAVSTSNQQHYLKAILQLRQ
jgi:hypothetical protein